MIVLYTTKTCPKCNIVKAKLEKKHINYTVIDDPNVLAEKGYFSTPVLEVDDVPMNNMLDINEWINKQ